MERNLLIGKYLGESRISPSCARIIYEYYGGSLMLKYGGGRHKAVGTCQFADDKIQDMLPKLLKELVI